ncbi:hypothetical protein WG66_015960 [Moniliophthora roreri]|nr:hypothetical protein WG66_015960 [Moniliophthora roreri]
MSSGRFRAQALRAVGVAFAIYSKETLRGYSESLEILLHLRRHSFTASFLIPRLLSHYPPVIQETYLSRVSAHIHFGPKRARRSAVARGTLSPTVLVSTRESGQNSGRGNETSNSGIRTLLSLGSMKDAVANPSCRSRTFVQRLEMNRRLDLEDLEARMTQHPIWLAQNFAKFFSHTIDPGPPSNAEYLAIGDNPAPDN